MSSTGTTDFPDIEVSFAFGTGVDTAASSWTDVTAYVRGFDLNRASRNNDLDLFDSGSATIRLENRDRRFDPLYASGPHFGDLVPRVQCRVRVVWASTTYSLWYGYVSTWGQEYPQDRFDSETVVTLVDGFGVLARTPLKSVWVYTVEGLAPTAWYRLGENAGTIMGDASGDGRHGLYEAGCTFNHRTPIVPFGDGGAIEFDGADKVGIVPSAAIVHDPYTVCLWATMPGELSATNYETIYRQDSGTTPSTSTADTDFTLRLDPSGHLVFETPDAANPRWSDSPMRPGRTYFVAVTRDGSGDRVLYVNGVAQTNASGGNANWWSSVKGKGLIGGYNGLGNETAWRGTIAEVVLWDGTELTSTNIADLYEAGAAPLDGEDTGTRVGSVLDLDGTWPASLRSIETGVSLLGPAFLQGTVLDYLKLCARTEAGLFYMGGNGNINFVSRNSLKTAARFITSQGTFGDLAGELPYVDIVLEPANEDQIINIARASRQGGQTQEYQDATSIATYGPRVFEDTDLLVASDGEALDRATWRVLRYKDPHTRVKSVAFMPRGETTLWPQVLARVPGDLVTIRRRPLGVGSLIEETCHISGITHSLTDVFTAPDGKSAGQWITTWMLEPSDPNIDSWAIVGSGAAKNQVGTALASY